MDQYRRLADSLKQIGAQPQTILYQGMVMSVNGETCSIDVDGFVVEDVRLRSTTNDNSNATLIIPAIDSVVIFGTLTGDLNELVVLAYDEIDSIAINGGSLGGLIKINELITQLNKVTARIDKIISAINSGTVAAGDGGATLLASIKTGLATITDKENYSSIEDTKIKH